MDGPSRSIDGQTLKIHRWTDPQDPRPSRSIDGQTLKIIDPQDYRRTENIVSKISGQRRTPRGVEYLVEWEGWSAEHDSWVPFWDILDEQLITFFLATREVVVNTDLALWQLRERIGRALCARGTA